MATTRFYTCAITKPLKYVDYEVHQPFSYFRDILTKELAVHTGLICTYSYAFKNMSQHGNIEDFIYIQPISDFVENVNIQQWFTQVWEEASLTLSVKHPTGSVQFTISIEDISSPELL